MCGSRKPQWGGGSGPPRDKPGTHRECVPRDSGGLSESRVGNTSGTIPSAVSPWVGHNPGQHLRLRGALASETLSLATPAMRLARDHHGPPQPRPHPTRDLSCPGYAQVVRWWPPAAAPSGGGVCAVVVLVARCGLRLPYCTVWIAPQTKTTHDNHTTRSPPLRIPLA